MTLQKIEALIDKQDDLIDEHYCNAEGYKCAIGVLLSSLDYSDEDLQDNFEQGEIDSYEHELLALTEAFGGHDVFYSRMQTVNDGILPVGWTRKEAMQHWLRSDEAKGLYN